MLLFPAIDILDGNCVRLLHGDRQKVTIYGDAVEMAERWVSQGAQYLHVVDLNGAFSGSAENLAVVKRLVKAAGVPVQLGGGIRTLRDIEERLTVTGVSRVILGTSAVECPELVAEAVGKFGERIACGIDVRNGKVSVRGWVGETGETAEVFGLKLKAAGVKTVIFTDIARDGTLEGVNAESTVALERSTGLNVIASGGVRDLSDLEKLKRLRAYGAILGKALYEGTLNLPEAVCCVRE